MLVKSGNFLNFQILNTHFEFSMNLTWRKLWDILKPTEYKVLLYQQNHLLK